MSMGRWVFDGRTKAETPVDVPCCDGGEDGTLVMCPGVPFSVTNIKGGAGCWVRTAGGVYKCPLSADSLMHLLGFSRPD